MNLYEKLFAFDTMHEAPKVSRISDDELILRQPSFKMMQSTELPKFIEL